MSVAHGTLESKKHTWPPDNWRAEVLTRNFRDDLH
jgi:hypothetical protein